MLLANTEINEFVDATLGDQENDLARFGLG
jgi:hypothetical protein